MKIIYNKTILYEELKDVFFQASQNPTEGVLVRKCRIIAVPKEINTWQTLLQDLPQAKGLIKNSIFISSK